MDNEVLQAEVVKAPASKSGSDWRELVDNPWLMVAVLFFVTAALGLPFLWISRGFSTLSKILLTIAVLLWTALVFWVFFLIMAWCWKQIQPILSPAAPMALIGVRSWLTARKIRSTKSESRNESE